MSHGKVIECEGHLYVNMKDYLNIMMDKIDALGMELNVYLDDFTREQYLSNSFFIKGFTAAAQMLAIDISSLTNDENDSRFYLALAAQMTSIQEAS